MPTTRSKSILLARIWALLWGSALVTGCAGLLPGSSHSQPSAYLLAPVSPLVDRDSPPSPRSAPVLLVSEPKAAPGYATRRMAYLELDYRLDYFADHEWVDAPAAMLGTTLIHALKADNAFRTVSDEARGIHGDLRLDTTIEFLYQDFRTHPSQARLGLRVRLVDPEAGRILATAFIVDEEPAPTEDPYGGVVATNLALTRVIPRIQVFAAENTRKFTGSIPGT
jgi:cholesterol transport system auxiliary component